MTEENVPSHEEAFEEVIDLVMTIADHIEYITHYEFPYHLLDDLHLALQKENILRGKNGYEH